MQDVLFYHTDYIMQIAGQYIYIYVPYYTRNAYNMQRVSSIARWFISNICAESIYLNVCNMQDVPVSLHTDYSLQIARWAIQTVMNMPCT